MFQLTVFKGKTLDNIYYGRTIKEVIKKAKMKESDFSTKKMIKLYLRPC